MSEYYDMDGKRIDLMTWARLLESPSRVVGQEMVGDVKVSTVLLGLNHNWSGQGPPLIFETMTFGADEEGQWRYSTKEEALEGHRRVVAALEAGEDPDETMADSWHEGGPTIVRGDDEAPGNFSAFWNAP